MILGRPHRLIATCALQGACAHCMELSVLPERTRDWAPHVWIDREVHCLALRKRAARAELAEVKHLPPTPMVTDT